MTEKLELTLNEDAELAAMAAVFNALRSLDIEAQNRVLEYVERRLGVQRTVAPLKKNVQVHDVTPEQTRREPVTAASSERPLTSDQHEQEESEGGGLEGVSAIARKWLVRSGLTTDQVSRLFSLGVDEIDLVAANVPGKSTRERLHNVILLQGVAAYLNSGAPRVENEKLKEAIRHYDADVGGNFATYMKDWASEFAGSRAAGFTLTTRGLNSAKELIKQMTRASGAEE
jgi:hypothetical protein